MSQPFEKVVEKSAENYNTPGTPSLDCYSQDDVQQILHLAIARQTESDQLTREQLVEVAQELGISLADLHQAEQEWLQHKRIDQERQMFNRLRRDRLKHQSVRFLIVNAFLLLLNLLTAGHLSWSLYVLLAWGGLMALSAWKLLQVEGADYEQQLRNWQRRRWLKQSVKTLWQRWMQA